MRGTKWDVVVLGGINTDFMARGEKLPKPGETQMAGHCQRSPGGKGANQAVAAARLGARVAMIGCVGQDDRGRELMAGLKREGVDTRHIFKSGKTPSGLALIMVDCAGEKAIMAALGANLDLTAEQVRSAQSALAHCKVLLMQMESPAPALVAAARIARKSGALVMLDPAPPSRIPPALYRLVDVIRPNSSETEAHTGIAPRDRASARRAAGFFFRRGVRVAILGTGQGRDLLFSPDSDEVTLPRLRVKSVDATGAGDAFAGGFAAALAQGKPIQEAARWANATAALSTTKMGAQAALPTRAQVLRFMRRKFAR